MLLVVAFIAASVMMLAVAGASSAVPDGFADKAFLDIWQRTDAPVLDGKAQRSWYWGPQPGRALEEPYNGVEGGTRLVQYFDKARMEINNPNGDRKSEWFVTTGLLVAEMVSGKQQAGDKEFVPRQAAEIAVAGDGLTDDPDAPTYTSFRLVASLGGPGNNRAPNMVGKTVTATINRAGQVGSNTGMGLYPGAKLAAYSDVLGHNIPQAMWDFLNLKGTVQQDGKLSANQTLANWVFVMGYPISEPYWARVKIGGVFNDALVQLYERRTLVYVPALEKGWQVQMGNVGQHYHRWLYGGPLPAPLLALPSPTLALPSIPDPIDATIDPNSAPAGTPLEVSLSDFQPGEEIVSWFTAPDGSARDARINLKARPDGRVDSVTLPTDGFATGLWAITFHGKGSNHEAVAYFYLSPADPASTPRPTRPPPTRTPTSAATSAATSTRPAAPTRTPVPSGSVTPIATYPAVPTEPSEGLLLSVHPGSGSPDTEFTFSATNLTPNEALTVKFTGPTGAVVFPTNSNNGQYQANPAGQLTLTLTPSQAFPSAPPGTWYFEVIGQQSKLEGLIGFVLR
ncbi:MAG TPA: hypothetical protein VND68_04855 [Chloroflexia bacterium]|jgi:hypothetical protein|nr:hypothetical protein [Chloroflexia bacterium]